ncbi:LamG-like jellyroll fold domain-containing protein [Nanoarchaeota archaeon]
MYNRSLSAEQIQLLYENRTDLIVSDETAVGDVWMACVTPNDGLEDGNTLCSNNLSVLEAPNVPPQVTTPLFNVSTLDYYKDVKANTTYTDAEGSVGNVTFYWYVNNVNVYNETWYYKASGSIINSTLGATNYTIGDKVNVSVRAYDGENYSSYNWSSTIDVVDSDDPVVTLVSPNDNWYNSSRNITLTCNATNVNLTNITLYTNLTGSWAKNQSRDVTGASAEEDFNLTDMPLVSFEWNCLAYDESGNSAFAGTNRTMNVVEALCGDTLTQSLTMTQNLINATGDDACVEDGLILGADDIVLDCNNYHINGSNFVPDSSETGIRASGRDNLTIDNCQVHNFSTAVAFNNVNVSIINNSNISAHPYDALGLGINLTQSYNNTIDSSHLYFCDNIIFTVNSSFNRFTDNAFGEFSGGDFYHAISLDDDSHNNTVSGNIFSGGYTGYIPPPPHPIMGTIPTIHVGGDGNLIKSNLIYATFQSNDYGIYVSGDNNDVVLNNISGVHRAGIYVNQGVNNNLSGNNISGVGTLYPLGSIYVTWVNGPTYIEDNIIEVAETMIHVYAVYMPYSAGGVLKNNTFILNNNGTTVCVGAWGNLTLIDQVIPCNYSIGGNVTIEDTGEGRIRFLNKSMVASDEDELSWAVNISSNSVFINSTETPGFNESAEVTLYGLSFDHPLIEVDLDDDGSYTTCTADTDPACHNLSWDGSTYLFNTTHFTSFRIAEDTTPPTWDQALQNQTIEYGAAFVYDVNASDPSGINQYWLNGTDFSIDSGNGNITNATALAVGVYHLNVSVNDTAENVLWTLLIVNVSDTTPPTWDQPLQNHTIDYGTAFVYDVNASDLSSIDQYDIDDSNFAIDSSNGNITNATSLARGVYYLNVSVNDTQGNILWTLLTVDVTNYLPVAADVVLNSTYGSNRTTEDLTVHWDVSDTDGDTVVNVTTWYVNNSRIQIWYYPFEAWEGNATHNETNITMEYAGWHYNLTAYAAPGFLPDGGPNGTGAYNVTGSYFRHVDYGINYFQENMTMSIWFKRNPGEVDGSILSGAWNNDYNWNLGFTLSSNLLRFRYWHGTNYDITGPIIPEDTWTHAAVIQNDTHWILYVNGDYAGNVTFGSIQSMAQIAVGSSSGSGANAWGDFAGVVDDFIYYNRTLSEEQIGYLAEGRYDIIADDETDVNETWMACITPNDGIEDGQTNCSNNLTVGPGISCGANLTEDTVLDADISYSGTEKCLQIGADDITLDCSGFTIDATGDGTAIYAYGYDNITIKNCVLVNFDYGIDIRSTNNSIVYNNTVSDSDNDGILVESNSNFNRVISNNLSGNYRGIDVAGSSYLNLSNNTVSGSSQQDFLVSSSTDILFLDQPVTKYSFNTAGLIFEDSGEAQIRFLNTSISQAGSNMVDDINISSNFISVRSDARPGFNQSANLTFYDTDSLGFTWRTPYRDGSPCSKSICSEITDADDFVFNVTGFTNYSVGEGPACGDTVNVSWNLTHNISEDVSGVCLMVESDVVFDCKGYTLTSNLDGTAFKILNDENVTLNNCTIDDFDYGVVIYNSSNVTVNNSVIDAGAAVGGMTGVRIQMDSHYNIVENTELKAMTTGIFTDCVSESCPSFNIIRSIDACDDWSGVDGVMLEGINDVVEHSTFNCSTYGLLLSGTNSTVRYNTILANETGIEMHGTTNLVEYNNISSILADGIRELGAINNTYRYNNMTGISISEGSKGTVVTDNILNGSLGSPIDIGQAYESTITIANNTIGNISFKINNVQNVTIILENNTLMSDGVDLDVNAVRYLVLRNQHINNYIININNWNVEMGVTLTVEDTRYGKMVLFNDSAFGASGSNFSEDVRVSNNNIFINSSAKPGWNVTANLTLYSISYTNPIIESDNDDDSSYIPCNSTTDPACHHLSWNGSTLFFNVSHFTSYRAGVNANLSIWDQNDSGMPYADQPVDAGELTWFFANYTNRSSRAAITDADCNITFNDSTAMMSYNVTNGLFEYNRTFNRGTYDWNVTCNRSGYETLDTSDSINILDTTLPVVALVSPIDGYNTTNPNITLTCNATNLELDNVTLYTNISGWGPNKTEDMSGTSDEQDFNLTDLADGTYDWNCKVYDVSNNSAFASQNRTFTLDSSAPTWDPSLTNQTIVFGNAFVYDIDASDPIGIDTYTVNDSSFNINATDGDLTNVTALAIGVYYLNVSVNDSFGNTLWTLLTVTVQSSGITSVQVDPLDEWVLNDTIKFECNASSANTLVNATLWHNYSGAWVANGSTSLSGTYAEFEFNRSGLSNEKEFVWGCNACDTGECDFSVNRTITTDMTTPLIAFVDPTPLNNVRNSSRFNWANINVSTTETNDHSVILDWNRSLIAWWRMEQENGTLFSDSSSYGNDGICNGNSTTCPEVWTGARGKAYRFDGVDDYVKIDYDFPDTDLTLASWFRVGKFRTNDNIVFDKNYGYLIMMVFNYTETGPKELRFRIYNGSIVTVTAVNTIYEDQWHFGVGTIDTVNKEIKVYVDGVLKGTKAYTGTYTSANHKVTLGSYEWGASSTLNGSIDEVMLWNRVLSLEEIKAAYQAGAQRLEKNFTDLPSGTVNYTAYTVDMAGNLNQTEYRNFSINHVPEASITEIKSDDETNYTDEELTVYYTSSDGDSSDTVKNITNWYVNGSAIKMFHMPFEATGGYNESSWAKDYSNASNHGTVTGATWLPTGGHDGKGAYWFNTSNDEYIIAQENVSIPQQYTFALWIKGNLSDQDTVEHTYVMAFESKVLMATNMKNGTVRGGIILLNATEDGWVSIWNGTNVLDGVWHHWVVTIDRDAQEGVVYIDGSEIHSAAVPSHCSSDSIRVIVGASTPTFGIFNGTLDDVRIYNISLTAEQVLSLYQEGADTIVPWETSVGDLWNACVTPNDGVEDGAVQCSGTLEVKGTNPVIDTVVLNSTYNTNFTIENLTVYYNSSNSEGLSNKNITNWFLNSTPIMLLNMPFERSTELNESSWTKDYSNGSHHGVVYDNPVWNATGGHDGRGAYRFYGQNTDRIVALGNIAMPLQYTIAVWIKGNISEQSGEHGYPIGFSGKISMTTHQAGEPPTPRGGMLIANSTDNGYHSVWDGTNVLDGDWHHWVGTVDRTVQPIPVKIYLDGEIIHSATIANHYDSSSVSMRMGSSGTSYGNLNGTLDDVRIYNRTLSLSQIRALYENQTDIIPSDETLVDDVWMACVTPNDGVTDGTAVCSNNLTILNRGVFIEQVDPLDDWVLNNTIKFECNGTSDRRLANASLWHNHTGTWHENASTSLSDFNEHFEFNITGFDTEKTFEWACRICDPVECNISVNQTITVDLTKPGIEFADPTPENNKRNPEDRNWAYINVSTTDDNNHSVILDWNRSLVGWWRLEQENGTLFSDSSSYGNDGTCNETFCPEVWTGARGKAYRFDGEDDYIAFDSLLPSAGMTMAAWVKIGYINTTDQIIFDNNYGGIVMSVFGTGGGPRECRFRIWNGSSHWIIATDTIYQDTWHLCVGTVDTVNKVYKVYVDGVLGDSGSYTGVFGTGSSINTLGAYSRGATAHLNGSIDEFMIWNRVLSAEEINATFQAGTHRIERNFTDLPPGTVNYTAYTVDMAGNLNQTEYRNFSVNNRPAVSVLVLNSTDGTNYTTQNLTVYFNTRDADADSLANMTNWYVNGTSIMVLNMPFEATRGNESSWTKDYSGNFSNHGDVTNATWNSTGGYDGKGAYEFDGDGDYVDCGNDTSLNWGSGNGTVCLWYKTGFSSVRYAFIKGGTGAGGKRYAISTESAGNVTFGIDDNSTTANLKSSIAVHDDEWHFVCGLRDGDNIRLYIDGSEDANSPLDVSGMGSIDGDYCTVGAAYNAAAQERQAWFNGTLDNLMIFNRSLSAVQILALYNNRTDLILSEETVAGETWQACLTTNDGTEDSVTDCSNTLNVLARPIGSISAEWITPTVNTNVSRNGFFLVRQNITCTGGDCGNVEVTLDPQTEGAAPQEPETEENSGPAAKISWLSRLFNSIKILFRGFGGDG